jgi:hypothetical protein
MAANEFAVAAFVHPQLQRLDDLTHARAVASPPRSHGKTMSSWYGTAFALNLDAAFELRPMSADLGLLIASTAALWAANQRIHHRRARTYQ